jgi:hypothetical protein
LKEKLGEEADKKGSDSKIKRRVVKEEKADCAR